MFCEEFDTFTCSQTHKHDLWLHSSSGSIMVQYATSEICKTEISSTQTLMDFLLKGETLCMQRTCLHVHRGFFRKGTQIAFTSIVSKMFQRGATDKLIPGNIHKTRLLKGDKWNARSIVQFVTYSVGSHWEINHVMILISDSYWSKFDLF